MHNESTVGKRADDERRRAYKRARLWFFAIGTLFSLLASAIFTFSGAASRIARASRRRVPGDRSSEAVTLTGFMLLSWLSSLPLGYLRGYRLEHQYELSNQTQSAWFRDQLKGLAVQVVLLVPVASMTLTVIRRRPRDWWLVLSGLAVPFTVILAQLAPVLILPIFNTYRPLRDQQLAERLRSLAARSGIEVAEVLEMDLSRQTKKANAFFAGLGRSKRIVLADTLIEEFTPEEIETVVAHEIAHQMHHDIWKLLAMGSMSTAALIFATQRVTERAGRTSLAQRAGIGDPGRVESLPLLGMVASLIGLLVMPVHNAFSRFIERRADDYALRLTDNPDAFAATLNRLSEMNLADPDPSRLEQILLHSHPSTSDRIARCKEYARSESASATTSSPASYSQG